MDVECLRVREKMQYLEGVVNRQGRKENELENDDGSEVEIR